MNVDDNTKKSYGWNSTGPQIGVQIDIKSQTQLGFTTFFFFFLHLKNIEELCVHLNANSEHRADGAWSPEIVLCKWMLKSLTLKCITQDYITLCLIHSFHSIRHSTPWYSSFTIKMSKCDFFLTSIAFLMFFAIKFIGSLETRCMSVTFFLFVVHWIACIEVMLCFPVAPTPRRPLA